MLLERGPELAAIDAALAAARQGAGAALLVEGRAGVGKTSLLRAAARQASDAAMTVLSARGSELEGEFAWGIVRQLYERPLADLAPRTRSAMLADAAHLAAPALGLGDEGGSGPDASFSTLHGLYWLTANFARRGPLLIAVDDVQWSDAPSLRFLAFVVTRLEGLPILVAMAARTGGEASPPAAELVGHLASDPLVRALRPAPLTRAASAELVRVELGDHAADEFCHACHDTTGGNPFLLRELVGELAAEAVAPVAASAEQVRGTTPEVVSRSVLLRLARLSPAAVAVARAVAVLGPQSDLRRVAALAGVEESEATELVTGAIAAHVLEDDPTPAFVHPILRAAVLDDVSAPERARWHGRAAQVLAVEGASAQDIAPHLLATAPARSAWVVEILREAAALAFQRGAPDVALPYLRRAELEPPADDVRTDVLAELGRAELTEDPGRAVEDLRAALALAQGGRRRASIALELGRALSLSIRFVDAADVLAAAMDEVAAAGDEPEPAITAEFLTACRWDLATRDRIHPLVDDIEQRWARGEELDARLHAQLAIERLAAGVERERAVEHARLTFAGSDLLASENTFNLVFAAVTLVDADAVEESRKHAARWLAAAQRGGRPMMSALAAGTCAIAAVHGGQVSDTIAYARQALELFSGLPSPQGVAWLVAGLVARGDLDDAVSELEALGWTGDLPPMWPFTIVLFHRGLLRAARGEHESAARDMLATGELAEQWGVHNPATLWWRSAAALSLLALGEDAEALRLAQEELELARRWGAARAVGTALRALGTVQRGEQGGATLTEAVAVLERSPARLELARALVELGARLRRAGKRANAREPLRRALDLTHRLGALGLAERAREELVAAGARPRRDALRGRDALTPSELRVARMAATGQTNRQIAQALFVTLRTVEIHLTNSYDKLGIDSRKQLQAALAS